MNGNGTARLLFSSDTESVVDLDTDHITIGRAPDNDVRLEDPEVSRHHARLLAKDGTYTIEDLGSQNGTFVNDTPVTESLELSDGDRITFAGIEARFHVELVPPSAGMEALPAAPQAGVENPHALPPAALEQPGTQGVLLVRAVTTLGRAVDNDILLDDPTVSGHHAKICRDEDRFVLIDLGSANGTQVNGEFVASPYALEPGDEIRLGEVVFTFRRLRPMRRAKRLIDFHNEP